MTVAASIKYNIKIKLPVGKQKNTINIVKVFKRTNIYILLLLKYKFS